MSPSAPERTGQRESRKQIALATPIRAVARRQTAVPIAGVRPALQQSEGSPTGIAAEWRIGDAPPAPPEEPPATGRQARPAGEPLVSAGSPGAEPATAYGQLRLRCATSSSLVNPASTASAQLSVSCWDWMFSRAIVSRRWVRPRLT